jgi:hypothetical protein
MVASAPSGSSTGSGKMSSHSGSFAKPPSGTMPYSSLLSLAISLRRSLSSLTSLSVMMSPASALPLRNRSLLSRNALLWSTSSVSLVRFANRSSNRGVGYRPTSWPDRSMPQL